MLYQKSSQMCNFDTVFFERSKVLTSIVQIKKTNYFFIQLVRGVSEESGDNILSLYQH